MLRLARALGWCVCVGLVAAAVSAFGADVTLVDSSTATGGVAFKLVDSETVAGAVTVTSDGVDLTGVRGFFGVQAQCTSAGGAPDVDVVWQESADLEETQFATVVTAFDDLTAETMQTPVVMQPPPMAFGRVAVVGNAGNAADTVCDVWTVIQ